MSTNQNPNDLRSEIESLTDEKKQLVIRIEAMETKSRNQDGFDAIFQATHNLRLEQVSQIIKNRKRNL